MVMKTQNFYIFLILLLFPFSEILANGWVKRTNLGGVGRHRGTGVSIGLKGYIGLGHVNGTGVNYAFSDWWEYDPSSNSWTQKADYLPGPSYGAAAFSVGTKGYVGSGVYIGSEWYEFDPLTNQWTQIANAPSFGTELTAFVVNDKGYLVNGSNLYEYNPTSGTWAIKASAPYSFSAWSCSFSIGNSGYVLRNGNFYEYKPSVDQWLARASFPGIATGGSAAFSVHGKGYVVAGYGGSLSNVSRETWEFNPSTNTWSMLEEMPGSSRRFVVGFSIGNKGYIGTGTNGTNFKDFWEFDYLLSDLTRDKELFKINTYPNPATDHFTLDLSSVPSEMNISDVEVILYDFSGRMVLRQRLLTNTERVDVSSLSNGTFVYHIRYNETTIRNGKIIVSK